MSDSRRPAGDLIEAVLHNMRANIEELKYSVVAPSRYSVYISAAEHARLEGILSRLQAETIRALNEELEKFNRPSWRRRLLGRLAGKRGPALQNADLQWHIEFLPDMDGELQHELDIVVHSDLILPAEPELGGGERTRRITTVHSGPQTTTRHQEVSSATSSTAVRGHLVYEDATGPHRFDIVRDSTTVGRGGITFPVDVRIVSSEDVSREHIRIRRDPKTGAFFLIDLSSLGTTLNGRHVPRGVEERDGTRRETGAETVLPDRARIGLADTVFIDFERVQS